MTCDSLTMQVLIFINGMACPWMDFPIEKFSQQLVENLIYND